jgi:hypothetical protein
MKLRVKSKPEVTIIGTSEMIPGTAQIEDPRFEDGKLTWEWSGGTDVCWDGQETRKDSNGETLFIGSDGNEYPESQLELVP